jgi:hypothetical protein
LRCSVRQVMDGSPPPSGSELTIRPARARRHPLILDGADFAPPALRRARLDLAPSTVRRLSACTFYPVFKEPGLASGVPRQP